MVTVVAQSQYQEEKIHQVLEVYRALVAQTRKERGCRKYELYQNQEDKTKLTMIEEWEDDSALEGHLANPAFHALVAQLRPWASAPSILNRYRKVF